MSQYLVFKIRHFVELDRSYQLAKFHRPRLSGSSFMRAGGKHPPSDLHALKKSSPYRVNTTCYLQSKYTETSESKGQRKIINLFLVLSPKLIRSDAFYNLSTGDQ